MATTDLSSEIKPMNIEELRTSFIGRTTDFINDRLNTVLDDPVLLRVAIRSLFVRGRRDNVDFLF